MLCVDAVLSDTKLCVCLLVAFWTKSNCFSAHLFRHSAAAARGFACCTQESNTRCGLDSRGEDVGPCFVCDSISSNGPHSISSSVQHMGCTRQATLERQGFYCTSLAHHDLENVFINSQHHMFGMACRTAKVTVGNQMKYSNMVKGRNHDQAFDETLEFVLAAGWSTRCMTMHVSPAHLAQDPPLVLHNQVCVHCSCCTSLHASIAVFNCKTSPLVQTHPFYNGNLTSEMPGDSKDAVLHGGDVLCCTAMRACIAHSAKCIRSSLGTHILILGLCQLSGLITLVRNV